MRSQRHPDGDQVRSLPPPLIDARTTAGRPRRQRVLSGVWSGGVGADDGRRRLEDPRQDVIRSGRRSAAGDGPKIRPPPDSASNRPELDVDCRSPRRHSESITTSIAERR